MHKKIAVPIPTIQTLTTQLRNQLGRFESLAYDSERAFSTERLDQILELNTLEATQVLLSTQTFQKKQAEERKLRQENLVSTLETLVSLCQKDSKTAKQTEFLYESLQKSLRFSTVSNLLANSISNLLSQLTSPIPKASRDPQVSWMTGQST